MLGTADFVLAQNPVESQVIRGLVPSTPVLEICPKIGIPREEDLTPYAKREPDSLVFWGAMDRAENVDAVTHACREVLPRITSSRPSARFYVAGSSPTPEVRRVCAAARAELTGFIETPSVFLSGKRVALLPLRIGAGIKVKTLECMAAGLPVVTTPLGISGIPGKNGIDFLVGNTAEELARQVLTLLHSPTLAEEIGQRARERVLSSYSFAKPLQDLETFLRDRLI
jgi:glycosyltransferase involved in cell wall biosynthesis